METNPLIVVGAPREGEEGDQNTLMDNWRRASETGIGCVIIDADEDQAALTKKVRKAGGYVYVNPERTEEPHPNYKTDSGAERVAASVNTFDRFYNHDIIINVYAALPPIASDLIKALMYPLANRDVDVATLVQPLADGELSDPDIVKTHVEWIERSRVNILTNSKVGRALGFSRSGDEFPKGVEMVKHLPIYAYKRSSLDRFVRFGPTVREMEERLEPERALENNMRVDAVMVVPGDSTS